MKEEEKIFKGILFNPGDPELRAIKLRSHKLSAQYSRTVEDDAELRQSLAQLILHEFGEGSFMQGPYSSTTENIQKSANAAFSTIT